MILFHFTSRESWDHILEQGAIRPTDPVLSPNAPVVVGLGDGRYSIARDTAGGLVLLGEPSGERLWLADVMEEANGAWGPVLVWLTDDARPSSQRWTSPSGPNAVVRITVDVQATRWRSWFVRHGGDDRIRKGLMLTGGDDRAWYVLERPVRLTSGSRSRTWAPVLACGPIVTERGEPVRHYIPLSLERCPGNRGRCRERGVR
jgi:hypothetical protein